MPHGGPHYKIVGTSEPYDGMVVKIGQDFYTSAGGGIEGNRQRVEVVEGSDNTLTNDRDIVTPFKVGVTPADEFFHPVFSNQVYYYQDGTQIPLGTSLHHHTIPARGDNEFMTQHTMDGAENVFTTQPNVGVPPNNRTQTRNQPNRTQTRNQPSRTRSSIGGTGGNVTPGGPGGGGNMNQGGGSY